MLYWLYDMPTLLAVALFAVVFVGVCWMGIIWISPRLVPLVHHQPGLNEILGDYLQYFGCHLRLATRFARRRDLPKS